MLLYPGTPICTVYKTLFNEPQLGRICYTLPLYDEIVADVFDFWMDDNEPRRVVLRSGEWELVTEDPPLHKEMYERGLFDA